MNPGKSSRPPASTTLVDGPTRDAPDFSSPTHAMRSPLIANDCAHGCCVSTVKMRALRMTTSAASAEDLVCCSQPLRTNISSERRENDTLLKIRMAPRKTVLTSEEINFKADRSRLRSARTRAGRSSGTQKQLYFFPKNLPNPRRTCSVLTPG